MIKLIAKVKMNLRGKELKCGIYDAEQILEREIDNLHEICLNKAIESLKKEIQEIEENLRESLQEDLKSDYFLKIESNTQDQYILEEHSSENELKGDYSSEEDESLEYMVYELNSEDDNSILIKGFKSNGEISMAKAGGHSLIAIDATNITFELYI